LKNGFSAPKYKNKSPKVFQKACLKQFFNTLIEGFNKKSKCIEFNLVFQIYHFSLIIRFLKTLYFFKVKERPAKNLKTN
jgi:hypothetical protein